MRLLNYRGRAAIAAGPGVVVDVEAASGGTFGPDLQSIYECWPDFRAWAASGLSGYGTISYTDEELGPPVPTPRQVFAIGLNYQEHADEGNLAAPSVPMVFTKFPASLAGPFDEIELPSDAVDFETELVVVVGPKAYRVSEADAWSHVAGLTCGQDLSDRGVQLSGGAPPQFSLGKSFTGFAPIGPCLVTPDEFDDANDVAIGCTLNDQRMQSDRTKNMIFPVEQLIVYLSSILPLLPGDLIFTGTPAGIGWTRTPRVTLRAGDQLTTEIEGIGCMRNHFVPRPVSEESSRA